MWWKLNTKLIYHNLNTKLIYHNLSHDNNFTNYYQMIKTRENKRTF
jgi:hypothetical protein